MVYNKKKPENEWEKSVFDQSLFCNGSYFNVDIYLIFYIKFNIKAGLNVGQVEIIKIQ